MGKSDEILKAFGASIEASCGSRKRLAGCEPAGDVLVIPTARIVADPDQPRKAFDGPDLQELAASLKTHGQLAPIRVRYDQAADKYIVIAGERRWRAACLAGLPTMQAVVDDDAGEVIEQQLVENLLRADLRPVEEAAAFRSLMDSHGWPAARLAERLSISPSRISRSLALLDLPVEVRGQVDSGELKGVAVRELVRSSKGVRRKASRMVKVKGGRVVITLDRRKADDVVILQALEEAVELVRGKVRKAA